MLSLHLPDNFPLMRLSHMSLSAMGKLLKREFTKNIPALLELSALSIFK